MLVSISLPFHTQGQGHLISCCIYPVTCLLNFQRPPIHSFLCILGFKVRVPLAKQKKRYLSPCRIFYDCDCNSQIASEVTTGFGSCFLQRVLGLARLHDYYYQCLCSFDDLAPDTLADPTSLFPCWPSCCIHPIRPTEANDSEEFRHVRGHSGAWMGPYCDMFHCNFTYPEVRLSLAGHPRYSSYLSMAIELIYINAGWIRLIGLTFADEAYLQFFPRNFVYTRSTHIPIRRLSGSSPFNKLRCQFLGRVR